MNKTPDPGEVVRDKVIPAVEELVASLAERVGPFAKEASGQVSPLALAVAEKVVALAHLAAGRVGPLRQQAVDAVTPLAQQTRDAVTPYAQQAAAFVNPYAAQVGPFAQQAAGRVGPLAQQAAGAVAPYAVLLREQGRRSGQDLVVRLEPTLGAAREAFSGARAKVTASYVPSAGGTPATASSSATPLEASPSPTGDGSRSLVKGGRSESVLVVPPPKKKRGWLTTLAVVTAAGGATYVVVRRRAGDKASPWQDARPTTPYEPPISAEAGVAKPTPDTGAGGAGETEVVASTTSLYGTVGSGDSGAGAADNTDNDTDTAAVGAQHEEVDAVASSDEGVDAPSVPAWSSATSSATSASSDGSGASGSTSGGVGGVGGQGADTPYSDEKIGLELETVEERAYEEPEDAVWVEQDTSTGGGPAEHPQRYDMAGAYVGVEPPEGYLIKGNERSMKYHLPTSNSYGRTLAQVWFATEEAAQQAGFKRAEH